MKEPQKEFPMTKRNIIVSHYNQKYQVNVHKFKLTQMHGWVNRQEECFPSRSIQHNLFLYSHIKKQSLTP